MGIDFDAMQELKLIAHKAQKWLLRRISSHGILRYQLATILTLFMSGEDGVSYDCCILRVSLKTRRCVTGIIVPQHANTSLLL
jgi:hypothetical protein